MRDLTTGSITRHLFGMGAFIGVGLVVQTLYFLVDLYFVAQLGSQAVAGVSAAGIAWMLGMAAAQVIAIGTLSLVARNVGARDLDDARLVFNQALGLSVVFGAGAMVVGYAAGPPALAALGADAATAAAGRAYLVAFLPSVALMFPAAALASALRAVGVVGQPMVIQSLSLALNAALAPVLILGWGTGVPLGAAGAGLATTIASLAALVALAVLFTRMQGLLRFHAAEAAPRPAVWARITAIGAPAGAEFVLMFVIMGVIYWVIRDFGSGAQAGFGIGARVMQSVFLPAMALTFAVAPVAGQNFGARDAGRVRATFRQATLIGGAIMLALTLLCQIRPDLLVHPFTRDPYTASVATGYLRVVSWNFVAVGLVFACSGMFQALGDTRPALVSSASRLVTFAVPALWLSGEPWLRLHHVWLLSAASVLVQAAVSLLLLRREFRRKLDGLTPLPQAAPA